MAKTKISEYDATAGNNTDIDSINIAEGMAPSNVNNAIRELMAHLKDMDAGTQALTSPQLTSVDINGGTIDGAVIGANSAAAITGTTVTGTSFVIGSADINENDLESIDGITAGTVAASKAVIVDTNKDVTGFRNVTLTGELDAATLDVSGDIDVDGTANLDAVDIDGAVDMASTLAVGGVVTANAGVVVDNITIDGNDISTTNSNGALTITPNGTGDLQVNSDRIKVRATEGESASIMLATDEQDDAGDSWNIIANTDNTFAIQNDINGAADVTHFSITPNATVANSVAAFAGKATFVGTVTANAGVIVDNITIDGTEIDLSSGDLTVDVAGNIRLDADDNGEVRFYDGGTQYAAIKKDGNNALFQSIVADGDFVIQGIDGSGFISSLTFDMSAAGSATFNNSVTATGGSFVKASSGATATTGTVLTVEDDDNAELSILGGSSSLLAINFGHSGDADDGIISYNTTSGSEAMRFHVNAAERAAIDSSGRFLVGTSSALGDGMSFMPRYSESGTTSQIRWNRANTAGTGEVAVFQNNSSSVGSISHNNSSTSYNTSSDYRLKENVTYSWDATTRLKQLKPARFNWIADDTNTLVDGFLAHEVSSVVPESIVGSKDATENITNVVLKADGSVLAEGITEAQWTAGKADGIYANNTTWVASKTIPKYQQIDQAKLVPLLCKTILELEARITALEA